MSNSFESSTFHSTTALLARTEENGALNENRKHHKCTFKILVEFMQGHAELAKGHLNSVNAKNAAHNLWKRLAEDLNAAGPPSRDVVGWKKVWSDYKTHLKVKMRKNIISMGGTGGGPSTFSALTAMEEDMAKLMSMDDTMIGESGATHFGGMATFECEAEPANAELINGDSENSNSTLPSRSRPRSRSRSRIQPKGTREQLLRMQVESTTTYQTKVCSQLEELNANMKRIREIGEKEYQLNKDKFKHKKKMDIEKLQLKKTNIDLRRQDLELETEKFNCSNL